MSAAIQSKSKIKIKSRKRIKSKSKIRRTKWAHGTSRRFEEESERRTRVPRARKEGQGDA